MLCPHWHLHGFNWLPLINDPGDSVNDERFHWNHARLVEDSQKETVQIMLYKYIAWS